MYSRFMVTVPTSVVAMVGSAGQARPEPAIYAQHSKQNTLCFPYSLDYFKILSTVH